jgi:DMSO/TMAO reductase YedYZ heme-binding membrane subunit
MITHIVTIIAGYAAARWSAVLATTWDLIINDGGVLLAVAGTVCLIMVVVTSMRAARRRLRYESWHLLHLYAYLGVGLALPHQLWTGQEFLQSPAATLYWWTLWAVAAGSLIICRLGLPLCRTLRHRIRVTSVVPEATGVVSVYLTGRRLDRLPVRAGQFLNVRFLSGPGWTRANP